MNEDELETPETAEALEAEVVEEAPKAKKEPKRPEVPAFIRAESGDSYLSIARKFFPDRAPAVVAAELVKLNLNRPIREGVKVALTKGK